MPADLGHQLRAGTVAPLVLLVAAFLLFYGLYAPQQPLPLLTPDAPSYLDFSSLRSGGYPFFLSMLRNLAGDTAGYTVIQRVLYALSILILLLELMRCIGRPMIVWLCAAALLFNFEVNRYHFTILTESLFLSISALFFACVLSHLRTGRLGSLATASLFAGVLIAIRPTGIGFLPALALLPLCAPPISRRSIPKLLLALLLPALAVTAAEWGYYHSRHVGWRESPLPFHLLAKSGMVEARDALQETGAPPEAQPLMQALEDQLAPMRKLIAQAPAEAARCPLIQVYEVFVQYRFAPEQRILAASLGRNEMLEIGAARLRQGIPGYLRLTADHLYCLWTLGATTESEHAAWRADLEARRPLPFEAEILPALGGIRLPPAALAVRWGMLAAALLLAFCVLALLLTILRGRRPVPALAIGGLCGLTVHVTFVLTAMTGIGIPRYVLGLWVPLTLGLGFAAIWVRESGLNFARTGAPSKTAAASGGG